MSAAPQPETEDDDGIEIAVAQAVAASNGDMRAAVRTLIVENRNLRKSVSRASMRGRFRTCAV
jgi:hypothetical protein